ncbi:hypothetical protein BKA61DRAFT_704759 [Leptodontidium sp. MPI-SDFR-AT-0119]|nr:hypothetical protein BKA61DRAFT_704759 [Leptodontidium sp. MPI-SDFR-AT-0119]
MSRTHLVTTQGAENQCSNIVSHQMLQGISTYQVQLLDTLRQVPDCANHCANMVLCRLGPWFRAIVSLLHPEASHPTASMKSIAEEVGSQSADVRLCTTLLMQTLTQSNLAHGNVVNTIFLRLKESQADLGCIFRGQYSPSDIQGLPSIFGQTLLENTTWIDHLNEMQTNVKAIHLSLTDARNPASILYKVFAVQSILNNRAGLAAGVPEILSALPTTPIFESKITAFRGEQRTFIQAAAQALEDQQEQLSIKEQ